MNFTTIYIADDYLLTRLAYKKTLEFDSDYKIKGDFSNCEDFLGAMMIEPCDIAILDAELAGAKNMRIIDFLGCKYPKTKLVVTSSYFSTFKIFDLCASNIKAYALKRTCAQNLKNIIETVSCGGFWLDSEIANMMFYKMQTQEKLNQPSDFEKAVNTLTKRELEVLKLMIEGKTNSQIAREIIVSINTAKAHVGNILTKLSARDRVQAVVKAVRANIF